MRVTVWGVVRQEWGPQLPGAVICIRANFVLPFCHAFSVRQARGKPAAYLLNCISNHALLRAMVNTGAYE